MTTNKWKEASGKEESDQRIGLQVRTASSNLQELKPSSGHNSLLRRVFVIGKLLKSTFRWTKKYHQIRSESPRNYIEMFGPPVFG
jgi:hypothetical protein